MIRYHLFASSSVCFITVPLPNKNISPLLFICMHMCIFIYVYRYVCVCVCVCVVWVYVCIFFVFFSTMLLVNKGVQNSWTDLIGKLDAHEVSAQSQRCHSARHHLPAAAATKYQTHSTLITNQSIDHTMLSLKDIQNITSALVVISFIPIFHSLPNSTNG